MPRHSATIKLRSQIHGRIVDTRKPLPQTVYGPKVGQPERATRECVLNRDGRRCVACLSLEEPTVDHIRSRALGGKNSQENLMTLCRKCNTEKAELSVGAWVTTLELQGPEGLTKANRVRDKIRTLQAQSW